ncbi:MAG: HAD hydrolase family protein [Coriobacteriales bacterium]|jgi:phosphoserine phosphatase|nr:HAD hydrolase family protein [Coriobacteriales bacterium]
MQTAPQTTEPPCALPPHVSTPQAAEALREVVCVYTDLDGTLFAPGGRLLAAHDGAPSTATAHALVSLREAGVEIVPVTGRNRLQGEEIARILDLRTFISELGCVVQEGYGANAQSRYLLGEWDNLVLAEGLEPGMLPADATPYGLVAQSGVVDRLMEAFPGRVEHHNPHRIAREVTFMLRGKIDVVVAQRMLGEGALPLDILDNGVIHPSQHTLIDCPEIHIYHLMPRGSGKAHAVAVDLARRGLSRSQAVSVGDSSADVAMGEHTGSFVLMNGGAMEKVLAGAGAYNSRGELDPQAPCPVFATRKQTADGWVEFADALLAARQEAGVIRSTPPR